MLKNKNNNELNNKFDATLETNTLSNVTFLNTRVPAAKHINKLGKGIHKRKHVKGGRGIVVGTRLTTEQMAKLESLVYYYTETTGVQATVSSVIADLIDKVTAA